MTSGIKHTYEYVKEYIESYGYTLLSEEYVNCKTKLKVKCPHGHIYEVTFSDFKSGYRCPVCSGTEKLTQEFINKEYAKEGYEVISKYINNRTTLFVKDKEGYICSSIYTTFKNESKPNRIHSSNPYSTQNIQHYLDLNLKGYKLLSSKYKSAKSELKFVCDKGHKFEMCWNKIQQGYKCPVCSGQQVSPETCITTTDPWMIKYFKNKEDAYTHSHGSGAKVHVVCPHCGKEKEIVISNIYNYKSIGCTCGDGISYPEKFVISMLDQLKVNYIKEHKPNWSNNKRYDFYLPKYNCIIECHGEQHYKQTRRKEARTLKEEQDNDKYKKELALNNGINEYVILDCRKSDLEQIKNSILNSELNNLFDLSNIDWLQCEEFALSNRVKEICDYWKVHNDINNEGLTTNDIGKVFNLSNVTIRNYLNKGSKLGWCNYNSKKEMKKNGVKAGVKNSRLVEILKNEKSLGIFPSCCELERQSEELFGAKLLQGNISQVCNGKKTQYKGYTFKYITKEEYEKRIKQIKNNN